MKTRIVITTRVRELLGELAETFDRYHGQSAILADGATPHHEAVAAGANREATKATILGIAWRLSRVSTGQPERIL